MGNLLDSFFPEEGQFARLRAAVTGQGATPERLFTTGQEPDRFAGAPVGNSSVYPQERVSVPTGDLLSRGEARLQAFKQSPVTNALMDAATPFGTIAGVGAKLVDKAALTKAQFLERQGAAPETIWKATGFHRDKAGNWLWEIDDSGMQIKGYDRRTGADTDPPGFYQTLTDGYTPKNGEMIPYFPPGTKVGDVIDHPELFRNYPQLAEMPLSTNPWATDLRGSYNPATKNVMLNSGHPDNLPGTAVHELSHGVQHIEELPFGGMPETFLPKDFKAKKTFAEEYAKAAEDIFRKSLRGQIPEAELDTVRNIIYAKAIGAKVPKDWQAQLDKFGQNSAVQSLEDAMKEQYKYTLAEREAYEKYRALHGEQTAEAAGKRVNLSPLQRKHRPFWEDYTLPQDNHLMGNVEFWTP